ncbi:NAD(P)-binding protein [Podospora aff. communis PSN243]|uniref:NAD(P)-binding protein n=1 Tax=Podospora aff. communis PSN243 TaxID=3040156 RepID=A0AAV9GWS2_9PEZI|nr:NAD(P)-binding protein [Podospora aff. communis PSN243]
MSGVVAIAGGTGHLGRALADAIKAEGKHAVLVLARKWTEEKEKEIGHNILQVDYTDIPALTRLLCANDVSTVISAINSDTSVDSEWALFRAAEAAKSVKRYIPSLWGIEYTEDIASYFPAGRAKMELLRTLEASELETTMVLNGFFADYFVAPKVPSYFQPLPLAIDIPFNTAAIPGSGEVPAVFTHTWDVAKFVAKLIDAPKWDRKSYIIGDKVTWNEFLRIAEEAKGVKFNTTYDDMEILKEGRITELPSHPYVYPFLPKEVLQRLLASFGVMIEEGVFDFRPERTVNGMFPEVKVRGVRELVEAAWKV